MVNHLEEISPGGRVYWLHRFLVCCFCVGTRAWWNETPHVIMARKVRDSENSEKVITSKNVP